jgi:hypothetical protein
MFDARLQAARQFRRKDHTVHPRSATLLRYRHKKRENDGARHITFVNCSAIAHRTSTSSSRTDRRPGSCSDKPCPGLGWSHEPYRRCSTTSSDGERKHRRCASVPHVQIHPAAGIVRRRSRFDIRTSSCRADSRRSRIRHPDEPPSHSGRRNSTSGYLPTSSSRTSSNRIP